MSLPASLACSSSAGFNLMELIMQASLEGLLVSSKSSLKLCVFRLFITCWPKGKSSGELTICRFRIAVNQLP